MSALNIMAKPYSCSNITKTSVKQMLLDGVDFGSPLWRVCGCGLNQSVQEAMKDISNVKVHLKTQSGNVNIK